MAYSNPEQNMQGSGRVPTAEILSVGTELLLGDILNTNARYLSRQLAACGIGVYCQTTVGDNSRRLMKAVADAFSRSDIVICTGGLGPTKDDLTKETVAAYFGLPLVEDARAMQELETYFDRTGKQMTENNRKQALVPKGARALYNANGTAPGIWVESDGKTAILLPGPPRELEPMFESWVLPELAKLSGRTLLTKCVKVFGIGESTLETKIADLLEQENPTVALYAKTGQVEIHVTAGAADEQTARTMCAGVCRQLVDRLGDRVYTVEGKTLPAVVVEQLKKRGKTVVTAESCTGGLVAKQLTDIPGASQVFEEGLVTYSNRVKEELLGVSSQTLAIYGAVSEETAAEMATGARKKSGADIALAITGLAGPGGGTNEKPVGLVYLAVADENGVHVQKVQTGHTGEREVVREIAALHGLDMIRRILTMPDSLSQADLYAAPTVGSADDLLADRPIPVVAPIVKNPSTKDPWYLRLAKNFIPWKGDKVGEIVRKSVLLVAIPVFIISACSLLNVYLDSVNSKLMLDDLRDVYNQQAVVSDQDKQAISYPADYQDSFFSLYKINPDVKGYIRIDGTNVDFPLVQSKNNDYYLRRNFKGQKSDHGVAFYDYRDNVKNPSDNLVIYGHNMRDSSMFGTLPSYKNVSYYKQHPSITMNTVYRDGTYLIFAAFYANADSKEGPVFDYHNYINFGSQEGFDSFYGKVMERSLFTTGVDVEYGDELITLSTCTYEINNGRFVVMARRLRDGENAAVNTAAAKANKDALYPKAWYTKYKLDMPAVYQNGATTSTTKGTSTAGKTTTKSTGKGTTLYPTPSPSGSSGSGSSSTASTKPGKTTKPTGSTKPSGSTTTTKPNGVTTTTKPSGGTTTTKGDTETTETTQEKPTEPTEKPTQPTTTTESPKDAE